MNKNYRQLILVLVVWALVVWANLPNNGGIHIGSFERTMETQLGLDLRGGMRVLLEAAPAQGQTVSSQDLEDAKQILLSRSNALGVSEVTFQISGSDRIVGEFPGLTDTSAVVASLKEVGQLAFVPTGAEYLEPGTKVNVDYTELSAREAAAAASAEPTLVGTLDPKATIAAQSTATAQFVATLNAAATQTAMPTAAPEATATPDATGTTTDTTASTEVKTYSALLSGTALKTVSVEVNQLGEYYISFEMEDNAAQTFADFTANHTNEYLAIVLDNEVIECPIIRSEITEGKGVIEGSFTAESANNLIVQLRYGALPVPLKVVESEAVGATLGAESVSKSILAGIIGLAMIVVLMIYFYRLPGVIADVALAMYVMTSFALFKLIPVTLTLPGIAGFVLSIGVAVDANILIFERMKEEMRAGRGLRQAIDLGWKRAWPSIRDSNISTLITCVILYIFGNQFGATIVKGFSVTLAIGVLVSLFTAIVATRTFLHLVLDNLKFAEHPRWFAK